MKKARPFKDILADELRDPAFREQWERTALARAVALALVRYRGEHGLSQRQLAERLGWKQSQVGRLELGEHTPSIDTLLHLARTLELEFLLDIRPPGRRPSWVHPDAEQAGVVECVADEAGGRILVVAG